MGDFSEGRFIRFVANSDREACSFVAKMRKTETVHLYREAGEDRDNPAGRYSYRVSVLSDADLAAAEGGKVFGEDEFETHGKANARTGETYISTH